MPFSNPFKKITDALSGKVEKNVKVPNKPQSRGDKATKSDFSKYRKASPSGGKGMQNLGELRGSVSKTSARSGASRGTSGKVPKREDKSKIKRRNKY